jgi:hypothetical protein
MTTEPFLLTHLTEGLHTAGFFDSQYSGLRIIYTAILVVCVVTKNSMKETQLEQKKLL